MVSGSNNIYFFCILSCFSLSWLSWKRMQFSSSAMYVINLFRKSKLLSCFQGKIIFANHEWFQKKIFFSSFFTCPNQGNHFASFFQWNPLRHHTIHRRKNYSLNRFREKNKLWTSFFPQLKTWRNNTSKYKTITRACGFIELSSKFSKNKQLYF